MSFKPTYYEMREVGKRIKSTKKLYIWRFDLDGKKHEVQLYTSVLSGKKKVVHNGRVLFTDKKFKGAFQFPFSISKNSLNIVQHGDKYEIRINNMSFAHLWENEKTRQAFNWDNKDE